MCVYLFGCGDQFHCKVKTYQMKDGFPMEVNLKTIEKQF